MKDVNLKRRREILFRAKAYNSPNNRWVYGLPGYTYYQNGDVTIGNIWENRLPTAIIPETIGQFIGLEDKNGVKIFEGDIIESKCEHYEEGNYLIEFAKTSFIAYGYNDEICFGKDISTNRMQIIGNIHDNPELLEIEE
jgi:hypothetical protein